MSLSTTASFNQPLVHLVDKQMEHLGHDHAALVEELGLLQVLPQLREKEALNGRSPQSLIA
jgi:hypothetical protein